MLYSVQSGFSIPSIRDWPMSPGRELRIENPKGAYLPTRLDDAWDLTLERQFAKTDATEIELAQVAARPAAALAPGITSHREFRLSVRLRNQ
jgi:hypothetical protein